ncbi:phosphate transporter ATP-binding protein [Lactobacillus pasteurii DSM 23907 = CRBIP 24.76]|uniref:Phosphate ABC transporter, ATP-binding protein n=1 Tax=Lactobacillus pasteurii DSM 23907 = CRBIP 24.76 TaxID=1423790 RepID=I7LB37_9LACO|nr:phosphate ABC transporter ATP-binding protein PstB [Lactobacillus pasteurii]KRK08097.1 phosphate transporter ATP-binding protein [Lactobacillus pasteurii DSM 23907 = CRBIP 24.76]TDG76049.1 hypothetical protein C5L33_001607 [Lactobacillus pasteurii]CCI85221.1 Phosphate ABC transporter, ATP-binding protein [Lactobacillus pasteurii DSM 23907 = CRBIP 24.76]
MKSIIKTENLRLYYGKKEALHGISLEIPEKQITALIGPSGCGKSTFLRSLNRMNDLIDNVTITGTVKINDHDIYAPKTDIVKLRQDVGMVFQQPNPFSFSIYENVSFGLKLAGITDKEEIDARVEESLKQAAIWEVVKDRLNDNAQGLSGGQQQRICIARVLATRPEVILMDEPTSALDPISASQIEETMIKLSQDYTIVTVTHNMQQASRISDMTALFVAGKVVEYDETSTIFMNPKEQVTSDYINGIFG